MNIKRIYFDMRMGQSVVFPVLAMINFIIISYSLTDIASIMPMEMYVPIVISALILLLIAIGGIFRRKQQSTDYTVAYENNPEFIKDMNAMLSGDPKLIKERLDRHQEILKKHQT